MVKFMLYKIYCNKFIETEIKFKPGLNVVLGTSTGDNSIGKTSMLLIIDFVFGGNTYSNSTDIINNVGDHEIYFAFKISGVVKWYCRSNNEADVIWLCDSNRKKIKQISINEYIEILANNYKVNVAHATFRDLVSRYMRVYGKDNHDEHRPLDAHKKVNAQSGIFSLIKIFDEYASLSMLNESYKLANDKKKTYNKALKLDLIKATNSRKYKANKKEIDNLRIKLNNASNNFMSTEDAQGIIDQELLDLKNSHLSQIRLTNRLKNKLERIDRNINNATVLPSSDLGKLKEYFGEFDESKFMKVETFHANITRILLENLKKEQEDVLQQYDNILNKLSETKSKLYDSNIDTRILNKITQEVVDLNSDILRLMQQNKAYEDGVDLTNSVKENKHKLEKETLLKLAVITHQINDKMALDNNEIYNGDRTSPILSIRNSNSYEFFTPNDTGTGIAYKGLILFDLAILNLTNLPIVIHDSILLKQTEDFSIEKIIGLYNKQKKQIFIAFDKEDSYTQEVEEMIASNTCLKLSSDGGELFGRSWGKNGSIK